MAMEVDEIVEQMLSTPPRCIGDFKAEPAARPEEWDGDVAAWQIACACGSRRGQFVGYPLNRYNTSYTGAAFVGPLAFECAESKRVTEVLDTNQHGYHAEACDSQSHLCGEGPREAFACAGCKEKQFEVTTSFFFWPASVDLVEDEPEEFEERAQDLFNEFVAHGRCVGCGALSRFTDFGKL